MKNLVYRRSGLITALALWLGACSSADNAGQDTHTHYAVGDESSVTIKDGGDEAHARPFAESYCESLGKSAQFRGMNKHRHNRYAYANDVEFTCVSRPGAQD